MPNYEILLRRSATLLAIALLTLIGLTAASGVLMAIYYEPTAGGTFASLQRLDTQIPLGWLVHSLHNLAGNAVIGLALVQMVVLFLGRRFERAWLTGWIANILLALNAIALSWTATILTWDQVGFWRFQIELDTIAAIPGIGNLLRALLIGGSGVSTLTVTRLYTLHGYVLAGSAVLLALLHLGSLLFAAPKAARETASA
ncbi:MAG: cytochrome bc complex cytochrome b subunit [Spirulinaceae cyanobacterium SM2_1_0]|nr:cytochrome bc complex cytochrome b subunit [Spirulinaceae cyanobacterium SM2_1_0]